MINDIILWNGLNASVSTNSGLAFSTSVDYYNGTSTTVTSSLGWMYRSKCVEVFKNRLFFGNTAESDDGGATWDIHEARVRRSEVGDPNTWEENRANYLDASYTDIIDKSGDDIVRLYPYGDELLIFKRNIVHKLTDTGGDLLWTATCIDRTTINNAPWTVATIPQGVIFLSEEGLQITDGVSVAQFEPDKKINQILRRIYTNSIRLCFG